MDRSRIKETMVRGISKSLVDAERLKSWAINRMAKETEKRIQPWANSPSFRKDLTFNEEKKQKRIPKSNKTSKPACRRPEEERAAILLDVSAKECSDRRATTPKNKSIMLKRDFVSFFFIVFELT
jgi:hypothetical protein